MSAANLHHLAPNLARFAYDRSAQAVGIVHFGIGAFHRSHQAWYTDLAMDAGDRNWAITGVSLRSRHVAELINPQDGLYTLTERSKFGSNVRLIGAVRDVLVAKQVPQRVIAVLAAPTTHVVGLTITEKGYCRTPSGSFDLAQAGRTSVYRYLADGLRRRFDEGLPGLTLLSCDNLADNGGQLERLLIAYLDHYDPALVDWFKAECTCPSSVVDRIVPATSDSDLADVSAAIELVDEGAVMTEHFSQWVIEDRFVGPRPAWENVGAALVSDVRPFETAKLRMLNGAHSALAYLGLERGHEFVHEAISDPDLRKLIEQLMVQEAAPTIAAAPGQDLRTYAEALLTRFANPELNHRLSQIAMDGSQKIPQRWLATLAANQAMGMSCPAILTGIAGWIRHLSGKNGPVDDPRAAELVRAASGDHALERFFGPNGLIASDWAPMEADCKEFASTSIS